MSRRRAGFTLIEVLASTLLTAGVIAGAAALYIQLSDASTRATARTAEGRHAAAVLDRVARDLEGAYLVEAPESADDPVEHPWLFLAEERQDLEGADHLRFVVLNHVPRSMASHSADLAVVSYALRDAEDGGYDLWRWVQPGLPSRIERSWNLDESRGAVLAEGVAGFGIRFMTENGEWTGSWDSSGAVEADQLPVAAEVNISLLDAEALELDGEEVASGSFSRRVILPVRPIDLEAEIARAAGLAGGEDDEAEDEDGDGESDDDEESLADALADEEDEDQCQFGTIGACVAAYGEQSPVDIPLSDFGINPRDCAPAQFNLGGLQISCVR